MHVTDQSPPTCIPQSITTDASPSMMPAPTAPAPSRG
jgi:hypothetical protein